MNYETPVLFSDDIFSYITSVEKVRESKLSCGCAVHILLALMVLTWLDCCGAFEDGNVFSEEEVEGGCFV